MWWIVEEQHTKRQFHPFHHHLSEMRVQPRIHPQFPAIADIEVVMALKNLLKKLIEYICGNQSNMMLFTEAKVQLLNGAISTR